jgi:hypothetical protein
MNKIVSEDAVRRAFAAVDEDEGAVWLRRHLDYCTSHYANDNARFSSNPN